MSIRDAERPLNGRTLGQPVVIMGWNGNEPRVTIKLTYDNKGCYNDPQVISQLIEDLETAYGHLMRGPREQVIS